VIDLIGREREAVADAGKLTLAVGPAAQYVVGLGEGVGASLAGPVRRPGKVPELNPSQVVLVGYFGAGRLDKDANYMVVEGGKPVPFAVDTYNFDEAKPMAGRVRLEVPKGWKADRTEAQVELAPLGRESLSFALTPGPSAAPGTVKVWVRGAFPGPKVAPSVSHARVDLSSVEPTRRESLNLESPAAWKPNISGNGTMEVKAGAEGGVSFPIAFTAAGDRWCYPSAPFDPPRDWRKFQALAFEYRFDTDDPGTVVRAQIIEKGGSAYITPAYPASREWRRVVALFTDCGYGPWSAKDEDGRLDLDDVGGLLIGCNTGLDKLTLEVRKVEVVGFD
jgi:hypothetical protein